MPFWLRAVIAAAIAAAVVGVAWWIHHTIWTSGYEAAKQEQIVAERLALKKREQENVALAAKQAEDTRKANEKHQTELAAVRAAAKRDAGKRVSVSADFCRGIAGPSKGTATGSDGQTDSATAFLPDAFAGDLRQLAITADETLADFRDLIRRVDEAGCFQ
jgi:hypothetical protein